MQKAPGQYRKTERGSHRTDCRQLIQRKIRPRFQCSEKDPKDCQVTHYYPKKKTVTLRIGSGQKEIDGSKKPCSIFLLSTRNLYLRKIIFVTDVAVLTIETIKLVFKLIFLKQFHFLKPLDIFMTLLKYAKKVRLQKR